MTPQLAEMVGFLIGDGNIYHKPDKHKYWVEFTGDQKLDRQYFENTLIPSMEKLFNKRIKSVFRQYAIRIRICSKDFVEYLESIGIRGGKKSYTIKIPTIILENRELSTACVRGIFDSDGSVYVDRRHIYNKPYIRIALDMRSRGLLAQVQQILISNNIQATFSDKGHVLYINGFIEVQKFVKLIGFANPRHIERIKAFCPELTTRLGGSVSRLVGNSS